MGHRITNNFKKRFGDRISMIYKEKPLMAGNHKLQNEILAKAAVQVLTSILKREPATEELLGIVEIKTIKIKR
jgi:hypothetical protein